MDRIFSLGEKLRWRCPPIGNAEAVGVLTIGFQQDKEAGLANAQQLLDIRASELTLTIPLKQHPDLIVCEPPVDL
ncbi:hypothetical protein ACFLUM_01880 [Chloroflexota bacterium]